MVSAKNNGTSQDKAIIRNKDGSIRKTPGRKPLNMVQNARTSVSEGNISQTSPSFDRVNNAMEKYDVILEVEEEIELPVGRQVINDFMNNTESMFDEIKDEREAMKQERKREQETMQYERETMQQEREEMKRELALLRNQMSNRSKSPDPSSDRRLVVQSTQRSLPDTSITTEYTSNPNGTMQFQATVPSTSAQSTMDRPQEYNRITDICGYKMKIEKFNGGANEDYDVWWENLTAFFDLYNFTEKEKVKLFNAHLGNEARKFVHNVNLREMETVAQLHEVFRKTFSDRYDWYNVLTTIKQKPDEQIRNYAVRINCRNKMWICWEYARNRVYKLYQNYVFTYVQTNNAHHLATNPV